MIRKWADGTWRWMVVVRETANMTARGICLLIVESTKGLFELVFDLVLKPLQRMICRAFPCLTMQETKDFIVITAMWIIGLVTSAIPLYQGAEAREY